MNRILTTGVLLLVLAGIMWTFPACGDSDDPVDGRAVDTTALIDAAPVDTTAALPDGEPDAS